MLRTVSYEISSGRLPEAFEGFRIAQLSDLHGALHGARNELLVRKIREVQPDVIVMTGDMADTSRQAFARLAELCHQLCERYPVYYVVGNHEQALEREQLTRLLRRLRSLGVVILDNSWCSISRGGVFVKLYGLVTPMVYYKDRLKEYRKGIYFSAEDTEGALGRADTDCFCILLAHNPLYFPSYRIWGADLTFSGHIHGGIIRIPGLGGLLSPDMTLFPKYDGGHFEEEGRHLVVSRGLGNRFLVRVGNPPELVVVTLVTVHGGS